MYQQSGKKLVKQQYLPHTSLQYGELPPTSGWDRFFSLGDPSKFQRVSRLRSVTAWHSNSGRQPKCGVEQRAPPIFGRATIMFGIGPHSSLNYYASAYNRGDNYCITRLKLNQHKLNKHASLTKNTANINTKQTKPRFGRLLRPPAWKRSGSIFWKVRDRRRDRREAKTHKRGRTKNSYI